MNSHKKTARIVGVLYIMGTVAGVLSVIFAGSTLDGPDYLVTVSAYANQMIISALFILIMALSLAMVPVVIFPVLKKYNETLALGYVVFRGALETMTYIATIIVGLLIISVGRGLVTAVSPTPSIFQTAGTFLQEAADWIRIITTFVFILGALMFYYVLYVSNLIPRWISGWGLIAAVPYLIAGFLMMFDLTTHMSPVDTVLRLPLGIQEMVLAVWLIVKGFNAFAIDSGFSKKDQDGRRGVYTP